MLRKNAVATVYCYEMASSCGNFISESQDKTDTLQSSLEAAKREAARSRLDSGQKLDEVKIGLGKTVAQLEARQSELIEKLKVRRDL